MLHADGLLSLYVSTDGGGHYGIAFQAEPHRCTTAGCHAIADPSTGADPRWQSATRDATVLQHEHQPDYPFDGPQPGTWVARF